MGYDRGRKNDVFAIVDQRCHITWRSLNQRPRVYMITLLWARLQSHLFVCHTTSLSLFTAFGTQPFAFLYRNRCYGFLTHVFVITFLTRRELAVFTAFVQMAFVSYTIFRPAAVAFATDTPGSAQPIVSRVYWLSLWV